MRGAGSGLAVQCALEAILKAALDVLQRQVQHDALLDAVVAERLAAGRDREAQVERQPALSNFRLTGEDGEPGGQQALDHPARRRELLRSERCERRVSWDEQRALGQCPKPRERLGAAAMAYEKVIRAGLGCAVQRWQLDLRWDGAALDQLVGEALER